MIAIAIVDFGQFAAETIGMCPRNAHIYDVSEHGRRRCDVNRLHVRAAADRLTRVSTQPIKQHRHSVADAAFVEGRLPSIEHHLQGV